MPHMWGEGRNTLIYNCGIECVNIKPLCKKRHEYYEEIMKFTADEQIATIY